MHDDARLVLHVIFKRLNVGAILNDIRKYSLRVLRRSSLEARETSVNANIFAEQIACRLCDELNYHPRDFNDLATGRCRSSPSVTRVNVKPTSRTT